MIDYFFPAQNIHIILLNMTPLNTAVTAGLVLIGCLTFIYAVPVRSYSLYVFGGLYLLTSVLTVTAGDFISRLISAHMVSGSHNTQVFPSPRERAVTISLGDIFGVTFSSDAVFSSSPENRAMTSGVNPFMAT